MKQLIIGIAGNAGVGKDTVGSMINYILSKGIAKATFADYMLTRDNVNKNHSERIIHFADTLKEVLSIIFGIPKNMFYDTEYKDKYYWCFNTMNFINEKHIDEKTTRIVTIDDLKDNHLSYYTDYNTKFVCIKPRTLMQYFGTNIGREQLNKDIWIKSTINKAEMLIERHGYIVIPDVRFKNEANYIQRNTMSLYGGIIMINRDLDRSAHNSEDLAGIEADYIINNNGTLMQLFIKVLSIIQSLRHK